MLLVYKFKKKILKVPHEKYAVHSRIHPLKSISCPHLKPYIKREDELGFGISGSKIRKYRTLIPFLRSQNIEEVVLIGSSHSNHILSFSQLLIENEIVPTLFLRGDSQRTLEGNALLISLLVPPSSIHWVTKHHWHQVEKKAEDYAKGQSRKVYVLPEGGFSSAALPGLLTLPLDVIQNEKEGGLHFDHFFIEAGTGFTASSLILGLHALKHQGHCHVLLLAEDEEAFLSRLQMIHEMFCQLMGETFCFPKNFTLYRPLLTKGFGKISPDLFDTIIAIARTEGFFTDPIYLAKLVIESKRIIEEKRLKGNALLFHCGGALTLTGFQKQLIDAFKNI